MQDKVVPMMRRGIGLTAVCLLTLTSSSPATAWFLPLGPEQDDWTDISANISGSYTGGVFSATGFAGPIDIGPGMDADFNFLATYTISGLQIDADGDITAGGTLSIDLSPSPPGDPGDLPPSLITPSLLLQGTFTGALFTGNNLLEFLFEVTDGTLAPYYGGVGAAGGIKMALQGVTPGTVSAFGDVSGPIDFTFSGATTADTLGVVPEPTSLAMLGGSAAVGILVAAVRRRLRMRPS